MNDKYLNTQLLEELNCPSWVIQHSKAVAQKARKIAEKFEVDNELIENGAILHDIGRCKTNNVEHAVIGAKILRERGFPTELVNIVERHIGAGIPPEEAIDLGLPPKDYVPQSLEEKIVAHADNLLDGCQEVELDFVIKKWESKMGSSHPAIERLKKLHQELKCD